MESLKKHLADNKPDAVIISGDITQSADAKEFGPASRLLSELAMLVGGSERLFLVPGNHDVVFDKPDIDPRWAPYCTFYNNFFQSATHSSAGRPFVSSADPDQLTQVIDRSKTLGLVVVEVNSSTFVCKGSPDEHRGQVTTEAINRIEDQLKELPDLDKCIRLAVIHHHPVLLPVFAEPGRQYDAVVNSGHLLRVLRRYGFHAILHGHKHYPHVFSDDSLCSWDESDHAPLLVISGGSASVHQNDLPNSPKRSNTFNLVTIKKVSKDTRVVVSTYGLDCFDEHGQPLLPPKWHWSLRRTIDRVLRQRPTLHTQNSAPMIIPHTPGPKGCGEPERRQVYADWRGNMPIAETVPSTVPGQDYEVVVRITPHKPDEHRPEDVPLAVEWSAGPWFDMVRCVASTNPNFEARFHYYAGMLVQARMEFATPHNGSSFSPAYVYAPFPERS
ncbi:MAG: metallophosphoesterase [Burkholderiales bacterium]|nr:metallophosphoesterase [Burkholderiales bacterium]